MGDTPDQLIGKCVSVFCRRWPADADRRDELRSEAGLAYARCLISHDPSRGSFLTHVWPRMTGAMLDYVRANAAYSRTAWRQVQAGEKPINRQTGEELHPRAALELPAHLEDERGDVAELAASRVDTARALRWLIDHYPREAGIVVRRMAGWTRSEVAGELGVSVDRIRQIEKTAFRRIKPLLAA